MRISSVKTCVWFFVEVRSSIVWGWPRLSRFFAPCAMRFESIPTAPYYQSQSPPCLHWPFVPPRRAYPAHSCRSEQYPVFLVPVLIGYNCPLLAARLLTPTISLRHNLTVVDSPTPPPFLIPSVPGPTAFVQSSASGYQRAGKTISSPYFPSPSSCVFPLVLLPLPPPISLSCLPLLSSTP